MQQVIDQVLTLLDLLGLSAETENDPAYQRPVEAAWRAECLEESC